MARGVTIYDVAELAKVSSATVSRVMNDPAKVAAEKRLAVLDAIKELNFVPKADAVINARRAYKKIGVVAPFFTQPSFMERLRGISSVLSREHYELVIYSIDTMEDLENYVSSLVTANRVDGLIFLCVHLESRALKLLKRARFPVCFVEDAVEGFDSVIVKNLEGGQKAAEYLWRQGCKNPAFVGERADESYAVHAMGDRLQGYRFFFANQGILMKAENVVVSEFQRAGLEQGIEALLSQPELPDCVFCSSDLIAARVLVRAREKGIDVPGKLKVLGFDNIDISDYIGLSSVSQNLDESGKTAARLILSQISGSEKNVCNVYLKINIVERQSTKADSQRSK